MFENHSSATLLHDWHKNVCAVFLTFDSLYFVGCGISSYPFFKKQMKLAWRREVITSLLNKHKSGHHKAIEEENDKRTPGKEI